MSNRTYRLLFGTTLLLALYFDQRMAINALIVLALFEAVTNWRLPCVLAKLRKLPPNDPNEGSLGINFTVRSSFEAERVLRITMVVMLCMSLFVYPDALWFFPWFMGFAILGAGVSGVCPMLLALKWAGFR